MAETRAIKLAFGERAYDIPISAAKSMTGHMSGGSGAFETVACAKMIETSLIHPTTNYHDPDPDCDLDYVPNTARPATLRHVLNNSFGFGGQNACLVIGALVVNGPTHVLICNEEEHEAQSVSRQRAGWLDRRVAAVRD